MNKKKDIKNKKITSSKNKPLGIKKVYSGVIDITRSGMAFVVVDGLEQDIKVHPTNLHTALDGDEVKVELTGTGRRGRKEGKVTRILKRKNTSFSGTIDMNEGFAFLLTDGEELPDIYIAKNKLSRANDGDKAVVKIIDWGDEKHNPSGEVTTVLDKTNRNDTAMKEILIENGFPLTFPGEVLSEAQKITEEITEKEIKNRKDLRETFTITIDPVDAKDFDDAISIKQLENEDYEIGVHIADVSHYVIPGTALDEEAYKRATSVYLADRVLPMLPEKISNNLCSLRPHEDKLTFSVLFKMSANGKVKSSWIGRTAIHSNHRFTYEEVQDIIEQKEGLHAKDVLVLNKISQKLRKKRIAKGAINFTSAEVRFRLDENAVPVAVELKESKEAHQLIEEFMLLANRTVAEYVSKIKVNKKPVPFPYRVHDIPDEEKLRLYVAFAARFGYKFDVSTPQSIAHSFNEMLKKVNGKPEQLVLEQLGIRTMSKAVYTTENIGHYGLGFENYCHFTSPIRRYPDVMAHRILADCLSGHPPKPEKDKNVENKCRHCSDMERKAMEAERAANKYKQVEYMQKYIGEDFDAVISGVARFGFWAETLEAKCEGMVSLTSLLEIDSFIFVDADYALQGVHTQKRFQMGDTVKIKVAAANLEKRQLDYELVYDKPKTKSTKKKKKK